MKKLISIIVIGISIVGCTIETTTNTTVINNNYYYGVNKDTSNVGIIAPPWKDKDSLITIGDTIKG